MKTSVNCPAFNLNQCDYGIHLPTGSKASWTKPRLPFEMETTEATYVNGNVPHEVQCACAGLLPLPELINPARRTNHASGGKVLPSRRRETSQRYCGKTPSMIEQMENETASGGMP